MATCGVTFTEEKREFEIFPTIVAAEEYDATDDATKLYDAMKGLGCNCKPIIDIVTKRNTEQLKDIETTFKAMFEKDLMKRLKSELRGNLERVVIGRFYGRYEYQAHILREAMSSRATDEQALIDVICSKKVEEMKAVKAAYTKMYERDLIKDLENETSKNVRNILVPMAMANRDTGEVDIQVAKDEAQKLKDTVESKEDADQAVWNEIFAKRSPMQLKVTWLKLRQFSKGKVIFDIIKIAFKGKMQSAYLTIAQYIKDPITYASEVMHASMAGLGTNNKRLIRTLVSRCEIDLKTVKERYDKLHKKDLITNLKKETSGDYKKILVALAGG